jgi:hypothetical protein
MVIVRHIVPLLPISVEVRWRRLPPFRVTLRGLVIGVALSGLLFGLVAQLGRMNRALRYHSKQATLAAHGRNASGLASAAGVPSPLEARHSAMATRYRAAFDRIDVLTFLVIMTIASLAAVAALGRVLDWSSRRLGIPTGDGPTDSRPTSPKSPNPEPEEPRS